MPDVFISHSSKDRHVANAACTLLEAHGFPCWIAPRDILHGRDWGEAIIEGITSSKAMVLIFSKHANQSKPVRMEVERAVSKGLIIIPFRIEDLMPEKSLEFFLSSPHWLDAFPPPLQDHLETLAQTLETLLGPRQRPAIIAAGKAARIPLSPQLGLPVKARSLLPWALTAVSVALVAYLLAFGHKPTAQGTATPPQSPPSESSPFGPAPSPFKFRHPKTAAPAPLTSTPGTEEYLKEKMERIIFSQVQFDGASVEEVIEYLRVKSRDLDTLDSDPARQGINLILKSDNVNSASITLDLKDVPMIEALRYATELAGLKYTVTPYAVLIVPLTYIDPATFITQTYPFSEAEMNFLHDWYVETVPATSHVTSSSPDPFALSPDSQSSSPLLTAGPTVLEMLKANYIKFPEGAFAIYNRASQSLIMKNTAPAHDMIEILIEKVRRDAANAR